MATAEEYYKGRSGTQNGYRHQYYVYDTNSDVTARSTAEAAAPGTHGGYVLRGATDVRQLSTDKWLVTVEYGALSVIDIPEPDAGTATYTFSVRVEPETFFYSVNQIAKFPAGAPDLAGGLVGVRFNGSQGSHEGVTVPAGPVTDTITYEYPAAVIPLSYKNTVRALIGTSNSAAFLGEDPGSMRFVECDSTVTSTGKQTITFRFAHRPTRNLSIGGQAINNLPGWDSIHTIDEYKILADSTGREATIIYPLYVYQERFVPRSDFATLGLPAV